MPASYPVSLATFLTYVDQPWVPGDTITAPDGVTQIDLTIDDALITRQIHEEIVAIEKTIGVSPFEIPVLGRSPVGTQIMWIYNNKAWGRVDANNIVQPQPPPSHNHQHGTSTGLTHDDHPQYMTASGDSGRPHGFTQPVTGQPAKASTGLVTYNQVLGYHYLTAAQVRQTIASELSEAVGDPHQAPMTGPTSGHYRVTGGYFYGPSDTNGVITINFSRAHFSSILTFLFMKRPFPGESMLGWYNYQYMEDQLLLVNLTNHSASIQFIEDIVVDRQAAVSLTWIAIGV
jgi:hypothetical protein